MRLPLANARLLRVVRPAVGSGGGAWDPGSSSPAEDTELWKGASDANVYTVKVREDRNGVVDLFEDHRVDLPAVTLLESGDVVEVRYIRGPLRGRTEELTLRNVTPDTSGVHPVPIYECTIERR